MLLEELLKLNRKKDYSIFVIIAIVVIIPLFLIFFGKFTGKIQPKPTPTVTKTVVKPTASSSTQISTTELKSLNNGKNEWILNADKIEMNEATRKGEIKNVNCKFFGENGALYITLTAPKAYMDLNSNDIEFVGGVKAKSVKNEYFETETIKYSGKDKIFTGKGPVKIIKGSSVIYGNKIMGIPSKRIVEIQENVRADIKLKDFESGKKQ